MMRATPLAAYGRQVRWRWAANDTRDAAIALVVTAFAVAGTVQGGEDEVGSRAVDGGTLALVVLAGLALALRRRAPLTVQLVVTAAVAIHLAVGYPFGPIIALLTFAVASAAMQVEPRRALAATGISLLACGIASLAHPDHTLLWVAWFVAPWAVGALVRSRQETRRLAHEEHERRQAYDERLRIAQEVHDVVGHGLSVIAMQAGVALHVLDRRPDEVRASLEAIRDTSTHSLDGLRATLALLRAEGETAELRPVGTLADLDRLVDGVRAGGLPVEVQTTGARRTVPTGVDHAAYRIIQEALTNVVRHASAAHVTVRLAYAPDSLELEIADDGRGPRDGSDRIEGEGIAGMRARATALAGAFAVDAPPGGGVTVRARLPLAARP